MANYTVVVIVMFVIDANDRRLPIDWGELIKCSNLGCDGKIHQCTACMLSCITILMSLIGTGTLVLPKIATPRRA